MKIFSKKQVVKDADGDLYEVIEYDLENNLLLTYELDKNTEYLEDEDNDIVLFTIEQSQTLELTDLEVKNSIV